ncbi:hypothetical protein B9T11_02015 [Wohlfahrtiimonas chitiniclastica]|uniref:Ferrous iron transporter FeoA-like domain-containing protein n=3 Tax=Ignatzschineriaceae TaxID=3018589 RepID=L8XYV0_9GAMM|nr:Hypothetical protein F387_00979 [Wohlfahrtiimonas chitiniclastica SH04]KZX37737.1 hypothetical protein A6V30_02350 [Wohlfahrtiimonas chitiniclastica]MBS7814675.1 ferrous iron transport protein A [Wohlfahrtiimonas chitiniclastica]MBS7817173.1 ferrous iron transport protein A [Wohlfahrtiimonas chitiniclastica]MBS7818903.1 ferrous iron transport protein A [Wohlfahrtiimonas chitiniclastica]
MILIYFINIIDNHFQSLYIVVHQSDGEIIMTITTLDQLSIDQVAMIKKLDTLNTCYRNKLLAMGITPGCKVSIVRTAPLGDPMQITIRGFQLCLRKSEAATIQVEIED